MAEPFELEPDGLCEPPDLPGRVVAAGTSDEATDLLLGDLLTAANDAVGERGRFDLVISTSEYLQSMWRRWMVDPDLRHFPWDATHLRLLDGDLLEAAWLQEALIWPAGIPIGQVSPTRLRGEDAALADALITVVEPGGTAAIPSRRTASVARWHVYKPIETSLASLEMGAKAVLDLFNGEPPIGTLRWYLALH